MSKLPALQFYPGDWLKDDISGCSLAAQGLWLRLMFVMHESDRYGYLSKDGIAIPTESIARRCGCSLKEFNALLDELERNGVPSRTSDGILFCRRMVRDAEKRSKTAIRVNKFRKAKRSCNADVTPMKRSCNADVHCSSSSSSFSSSIKDNNNARGNEKCEPFDVPIQENPSSHEVSRETLSEFLISDEVSNLAQEIEQIDSRIVARQTANWLPERLKQVDKDFILGVLKTFLNGGGGPSLQFRSYLDVAIGKHLGKQIKTKGEKHEPNKPSPRNYGYAENSEQVRVGTVVNIDELEKRG